MARQVDGVALALIGAGATLAYAGIKGKSVPAIIRGFVQGKNPSAAAAANAITGSAGSSNVGAGLTGATASGSEQSFFTAVLKDLGAPVTSANLQAFYRWAAKEEPSFPPPNAWNPLNIKASNGSFQQWANASTGAFGTAQFMLQNNYGAIVSSLMTGNGITDSPAVASELLAWSGGGYSSVNSGGG